MKKLFIALLIIASAVGNVFSQTMLISGGSDHGVALCNKGEIFAWGNNKGNRLGLKPPYDSETVVNKPQLVNIPVGLTFSQVSAGSGSHTVALSCKKIVYAWGENDKYQAGQATGNIVDKPMPVLCGEATDHGYDEDGITKGKYLGDVKKIAATTSGSLALLDDGTAVMWGGNGDFQGGETYPLFKASTATPIFIRDENNKILKNIIDIYGGDNNLTIIVGNSPTDMTGTVYSMGNWNGRGSSGAQTTINESCFYALPVIIADPNDGKNPSADNKTLNAVKTSGIADAGGFAFDENEGFLYSWGNNGWGGMVGLEKTQEYTYASKVIAGEYAQISKEAYMTNVHQVIGGNGYGALVTEDGYLLYMGGHNTTGRDGGIVPSSEWAASTKLTNGTGNDPGPIFAKYCKGEKDPNKEVIVNDAAAIGRGDLFGFMVNKDGDFYVWGNTKWPGNDMPDEVGTLGLGFNGASDDPEGKGYRTCLSKLELLCTPQDECPKIYMVGPRKKCPGETDSLYCGFTPTTKSVRHYFFRWSLDGVVLNESTLKQAQDVANEIASTSDENAVITDPWNNWIVEIKDPGTYKVEIFYIGNNVPCTNCETAEGEIEVIDMDMPIDTLIPVSCVADTLKPSSADQIEFKAVVNNKFYSSKDKVTFAAFATPTSKDTLKDIDGKTAIFNTTGDGGEINFKVTGDQIERTIGVETGEDTLYHVWLEDVTKFETNILEQPTNAKKTSNGQRCLILKVFSTSELSSFSVYAEGNTYSDAKISVKPIIYLAGKVKDGNYTPGSIFWEGETQDTIIPKGENQNGTDIKNKIEMSVKCGVELPGNSARGTEYVLSAIITFEGNGEYYLQSIPAATNMYFDNPIVDSEGYGIQATGTYASNGTGGGYSNTDGVPFYNITFGKMTDYNCGRIMLSSKFWCPPCNNPKALKITASENLLDDASSPYKNAVELCKETSELVLDIEPLEGQTDPNAKFDIHWFDKNPISDPTANAIEEDESGSATTLKLTTDWATVAGASDIEKDVDKIYYVKVHDHEKVGCYNYDSIKVIAHPVPIDTLEWIEFCEGELAAEPTFEIAGKKINWIDEPKDVTTLTGPTGTGTKEYTYKYTVTDDETGCEGEEHTLTISVNKTGKPDVKENISLLKDPSVKYNLSAAKNDVDPYCEIRWYETETATSEMTNTSITLDEAKTIEVWAEQYNTETGCTSERVKVVIVINDAPVPEVTNESLCIDNEIPDLSEYVKPKDSDHTLNWYDDPSAAKGTGSQTAPSFKATAAGKYNFYVSQTNTKTDAESEKATLTITVHEVATLDLSKNKLDYCINDQAEELTFSAKNDGDFTTAKWSKKSDMSDAVATLTPSTDEKGEATYYVQAEYTNADAQNNSYASTVCPGKIQTVTITTYKTDVPGSETNYTVQYLKAEGDKNQSYKSLLDQDGTAIKVEPGHSLKWYDSDKKPLNSEPAPEYVANETGERKVTYYVSQVNQSTGCESELKEVTVIISSFPAPEVKAITLCQESEKLKSPFPLTATISTKGGFAASDYQLIWYKEDPKANPLAEEFINIDLSLENLSYDATTETEKDFKYWVVQRYTGPGGGQSPAAELLVTIYSKPILKTKTPDPICLGGEVDLKDLYSISNRISNQQYELEYLSANGTNPKGSIATEHGQYECRAWFELSNNGDIETCSSKFEDVYVTVNELEVAITGDNTTCPGVGVDLKAVLTTKNMDANDTPSYSWNISPTGVTGQMETLNTSEEGLVKKGDKITVNLEVSMGACKGKKPADAHIVTVDDPGVDGTIKFDEQYNTNSGQGTYTLSKNGIVEFDGCNSKVEVAFNVKQTEDEFTYENLETGDVKTGTFSNGEGKFNIKAGLYEVTYTNTCKTSFKFEVKDKSLNITGSPTNWAVCEGTPLTINIINKQDKTPFAFDPKKYTIEWQKDGVTLPEYTTETLYIPSTTPADNGVYSYIVTSSGCVYHDKIAMGGRFISKPKVKIDESRLAKDGIYEAVRTTTKEITIPIVQSIGIDMTKLSKKIVWNEDGNEINKGETLSVSNVDKDHEYKVVIANGDKGSDTEFCGTTLNITLKVDALLSIKSVLVDGTGKQTKDMCVDEEGVGFQIDTTGTGTILHPDKFTFKVVETIDGKEKEIKMAKKDDYLFAEISPDKSAKYQIVYKYSVDNQDKSETSEITVHPAYNVDWDRNVRLCEGETGFIQITKAEPASEIMLTWEADECLKSGSKSGADVEAVFSGNGLSTRKALTLVASNGGICAEKKYYPEFTIDKAIEGEITAPEFICEGHTATLDASPFKATEYVWSSADQLGEGVTLTGPSVNVVSKSGYATYSVEMKRGACTQTAETTFEVRHAPKFDRIDSLSFRTVEIVLESNIGTPPFQYIVDDKQDGNIMEPVKDSLEYGTHSIKVIDAAGCIIDTIFVTNAPGFDFPIHISPNDDGINDAFSIPILRDAYPDANIRIYDRWGKKLADYKAGDSNMDWDGTYNGVQMPSTDYWYEIEIKEIKKTYTGHFTLIRQ
ncbi:MAG: T9SS type B sorting domain-containing protein [Paludibacteraceae bacterium]|nr:T9SS type B sorting domain-containing protein [Paludibacteraceae bacterium]